jgi:transposase-like protein
MLYFNYNQFIESAVFMDISEINKENIGNTQTSSKKKKKGRPRRHTNIKCPNPNCEDRNAVESNVICYGQRETKYCGNNQKYLCKTCGKIFSKEKKYDAETIYNEWFSNGVQCNFLGMEKKYNISIPTLYKIIYERRENDIKWKEKQKRLQIEWETKIEKEQKERLVERYGEKFRELERLYEKKELEQSMEIDTSRKLYDSDFFESICQMFEIDCFSWVEQELTKLGLLEEEKKSLKIKILEVKWELIKIGDLKWENLSEDEKIELDNYNNAIFGNKIE